MEHTSDIVYEGKQIGETSYSNRSEKFSEIELQSVYKNVQLNAKIDYYHATENTIHEIKKSNKIEKAHIAQVKFYMYMLIKNGVLNPQAIIEYPKLRERKLILWETNFINEVERQIEEAIIILSKDECPSLLNKSICKQCSYYDFCYSGELLS